MQQPCGRYWTFFGSICSCTISESENCDTHFRVDINISGLSTKKTIAAMIDSGATGIFILSSFVCKNNIVTKLMKHHDPIVLYNIDGSRNKAGTITHVAKLCLQVGNFDELVEFLITNISTEDVILGIPWL